MTDIDHKVSSTAYKHSSQSSSIFFCWILVPLSSLSSIPCSSRNFTQKSPWIVLSWIGSPLGSPLTCLVSPNTFLWGMLCQWRLLLSVVSRRDQCSVPSFFLSTPDSWQNSFKSSHRLTLLADDSELYSYLPAWVCADSDRECWVLSSRN